MQDGALSFLAGGGEMGERIRSYDWASTPLGSPEDWPQSLKTSIRIMLMSRQPVWIGWGRDLVYFYNDPYFSIIGGKHPWALGQPTRNVWHEIWDVIGPMLATAMSGDEGTYVESQLLIMERNGYPEETYYTFSYSPIPDDDGRPGGIFCANSDDTQRVIGQRELALLRDLAERTAKSKSPREACDKAAESLATNAWDLPFAAIYLVDEEDGVARLQGASGIVVGHPLAPPKLSLDDTLYPIGTVHRERAARVLDGIDLHPDIPSGVWPIPPRSVIVLPLVAAGESTRGGALVVGISPYRLLNDGYRGFLSLVAGQIAAALSDAEALERERQRLEAMAELDRAKTTFFANVSHEFRTPLTLMLGPLQDVLANDLGEIPAVVGRELETVRRNGLRLQKLVNALLDFSRMEAGRMRTEYRPTDLAAFTREIANAFATTLERAGLRFEIDCPPLPKSVTVYVDRDLWEKVVLNLLSNAFKHTFEGEVKVAIRLRGHAVELEVCDTGIGIAKADQPLIFERFRRVEGSQSRTHEGSGIGLALVSEIVKLHGGEIGVVSETDGPNHGTTFTITIPTGRAHLPSEQILDDAAPSPVQSAEAVIVEAMRWLPDAEPHDIDPDEVAGSFARSVQNTGARILVADDNADMRGYVSRFLGRSYRVEAVPDGEAALRSARRNVPDLLITDVMMPRLDGIGLVKAIRKDPAIAQLPVIMLSARAGEEARIEGLGSGADDYLVKPFSARELVARVDSALTLDKMRREAREAQLRSEERLQMALGAARMVAWRWDPRTNEIATSENAHEIFGLTDRSAVNDAFQLWPFIHPEDREAHRLRSEEALARRGAYESQFRFVRPGDGSVVWFEDRGQVSYDDEGRPVLIGVMMDITERKRVEQEREDAEALLAAEKRVLEAITTGKPLLSVLELLIQETEALTRDGMIGSILLTDPSGTRLLRGSAPSLPATFNEAVEGIAIGPAVGSCGTAAYRREPVYVEDLETDPLWVDFREFAMHHGLRACSSIPFFSSQGDLLGTISMYFGRPQLPSSHDLELAERAARLAGIVVERDRAIAEAESERTRLRDLFTRAPAIIAVLKGPEHVYELANPTYLHLIGRTDPSEVVGKPVCDVLPEVEEQGYVEILDRVYQTGVPFFGNEMRARVDRRGDGELEDAILNFVYQPSRNALGETDGVLVLAIEVTEQVEARKRLEQMAQELEERVQLRTAELLHANEQLQGFTYSVAHDLRQHIRGINTNAAIVLEDAGNHLDERSRYHLERLTRASRKLGEFVDDLLAYARLGKATPACVSVDLTAMAHEIANRLDETGQCPTNVTITIEPTPPAFGDPSMLRVVMENLLDNACKFSRNGSHPRVEFGWDPRGYYVRDNGAGFDMAYAQKLFQPFERLHSDESFSGTGIGLANVRRIVDKHGGQVWAEGEPGKGATFRFSLPTAREEPCVELGRPGLLEA